MASFSDSLDATTTRDCQQTLKRKLRLVNVGAMNGPREQQDDALRSVQLLAARGVVLFGAATKWHQHRERRQRLGRLSPPGSSPLFDAIVTTSAVVRLVQAKHTAIAIAPSANSGTVNSGKVQNTPKLHQADNTYGTDQLATNSRCKLITSSGTIPRANHLWCCSWQKS